MKVYLAGSLFNEAEVSQRLKEGKILREEIDNIDLFNPIEQPFNEDKQTLPTAVSIYEGDANAVFNSDVCIFDVTNDDPGVMVELGLAIAWSKKIVAINSDIRLKSANKYDIPSYSMNHFVLGAIQKHGVLVYSFKEAVEYLKSINK